MDLAKALEEELVGPIDDIPLRFFSVKKNGLIAAATDRKSTRLNSSHRR